MELWHSVTMIVKFGGRVAECHSTETCVTVTHCLSVSKICRNSDIGVVKCIGAEWNSGIVIL